jgi:shikimate dehydrogenase
VAFVLKERGFEITYVSRNPRNETQISYAQVTPDVIRENRVIVNTSPVGMYPDTETCPALPYDALTPDHLLYDLVYNPPETRFMTLGRKEGANVINGLRMLHLQAERAWQIWNSEV